MAKPETMIEYAGRLEREHAAMKAKINATVRRLDVLSAYVTIGSTADRIIRSIQKDLRS